MIKKVSLLVLLLFLFLPKAALAILPDECDNLGTSAQVNVFDALTNSVNEVDLILCEPRPKITIPGLTFSDPNENPDEFFTQESGNGTVYLLVPFLGEYLVAIYRYSLVVITVVAVIAFIISGVQYMIPGEANIGAAKKRMLQSVGGLVLAFGSYVLLYNINPVLTQFRRIPVEYIPALQVAEVHQIEAESYFKITGKKLNLDQGSREENVAAVSQIANQYDMDVCLADVIVRHESRGNPAVVGHDEDYPGANTVSARYNFLASGVKYSGETFTLPGGFPETLSYYRGLAPSNRKNINSIKIFNDDGALNNRKQIILGDPPNYGIDWRFSHGFGLGQVTIDGDDYCNKSQGIRGARISALNTCITVPELLTVEGGTKAMVGRLLFWYRKAKQIEGYTGPDNNIPEQVARRTFAMYGAGGSGGDLYRDSINNRVSHFNDCKQSLSAGQQQGLSSNATPTFLEKTATEEDATTETPALDIEAPSQGGTTFE